jgi:hypothetical protein
MQVKRMNWFQKRPVYKIMEARRERHRTSIETFQANMAAAASTFAAAQTSLSSGLAEIAAQLVIQRSQTQLQAKIKSDLDTAV